MSTCPHCDAPVLEGVMRGTGRVILLDPEPRAIGNLHYVTTDLPWVQFVPPERRSNPDKPTFVPPEQRYQSHFVTCPAHCRTTVGADS